MPAKSVGTSEPQNRDALNAIRGASTVAALHAIAQQRKSRRCFPQGSLNRRLKLRGDMHALCAASRQTIPHLRLHKIQVDMLAKRSRIEPETVMPRSTVPVHPIVEHEQRVLAPIQSESGRPNISSIKEMTIDC